MVVSYPYFGFFFFYRRRTPLASYRTRPDEHARLGVHRVHCSSTSEPGRLSVQVLRTARSIVMIDWLDELLSFSLPPPPPPPLSSTSYLAGRYITGTAPPPLAGRRALEAVRCSKRSESNNRSYPLPNS